MAAARTLWLALVLAPLGSSQPQPLRAQATPSSEPLLVGGSLRLSDFVAAMGSCDYRHGLVFGSRPARLGMRTLVLTNISDPGELAELNRQGAPHNEVGGSGGGRVVKPTN